MWSPSIFNGTIFCFLIKRFFFFFVYQYSYKAIFIFSSSNFLNWIQVLLNISVRMMAEIYFNNVIISFFFTETVIHPLNADLATVGKRVATYMYLKSDRDCIKKVLHVHVNLSTGIDILLNIVDLLIRDNYNYLFHAVFFPFYCSKYGYCISMARGK